MKNKLPTLYHKNAKGKIVSWEAWSENDYVCTRWGLLEGKQQESRYQVEAKNEGRSNATTTQEQAILEATSLWNYKLERKYFKTLEEAERQLIFLPMLAKSFEDRKRFLDLEEDYPCTIQPKLDGTRSLVSWDEIENEVKLTSRAGKEYMLPHLIDELEPELPGNLVLDGELYIHGIELQTLNTLVRRTKNKNPDSHKVEYHVYDIIDKENPNLLWRERIKLLEDFFKKKKFNKIKMVKNERVYNEEEVFEMQSEFISEGYEGAIIRLMDGVYKFGYRSSDLLKVKSFKDDEFKIINYTNGIGKFENCIVYTCQTKSGKEFNVVPKGTFEQRKQWLEEGKSHIGQMLKVRYATLTNDGVPQFPVGICIRPEEDM